MTQATGTAVRLSRTAVVVVLSLGLLLPAGWAVGAGTGGVEISPYPGVVDGKQVTAFHVQVPRHGSQDVRYALRNTTKTKKSAHLYAASAVQGENGAWTIGDAGSTPYLDFTTRDVTLLPEQVTINAFPTRGDLKQDKAYAALVVEVQNGAITQRAATLVYLTRGPAVSVPLLIALIAGLLLVAAAGAVVLARRRSRT